MSAALCQPAELNFGHPPETFRFWKRLVREALRFSGGRAAVAWHDERGLRIARERQEFEEWWGGWS